MELTHFWNYISDLNTGYFKRTSFWLSKRSPAFNPTK